MGWFSKNDSESDSESSASTNVAPWQADAYQQMYGPLAGYMQQIMGGLMGMAPGASGQMNQVSDASMLAYENMMNGGAYDGMNLQGQYNNLMNTGGGAEQAVNTQIMGGGGQNDYADAMKGQIMGNAQDAQNQLMQNLDARAAASGMSGGSRHGIATAQGMDDINQTAQNQLTNIGYNTFDKNLDRMMEIGRNSDMADMMKLQTTANMLGDQNQAMQSGMNFGQQQQNLGLGQFAPWLIPGMGMQGWSDIIGDPMMESEASSSSSSDSGGWGIGSS